MLNFAELYYRLTPFSAKFQNNKALSRIIVIRNCGCVAGHVN